MSSTVTFSRSRMLTSICWWRRGISAPASATTVRSSSRLRDSRSAPDGDSRNARSTPFAIQLTAITSGWKTTSSQARMCAAGNATRSGCSAASVFGATSANIRMTRVRRPVARAMPASPSRRNASTVASEDAAMFTKLFPRRIRPMSRSGRSRSWLARRAPRCPARARWRSRYRFRAIMPVSEPEKQAERMMRTTRAAIRMPGGTSLKRGGSLA